VFDPTLGLFLKCPNDNVENDKAVREGRALPSCCPTPQMIKEFEVLGVLMGMSARLSWSIPLQLARSVWKQLLGLPKTMIDIKQEDLHWYELHTGMKESSDKLRSVRQMFTVQLSDGTTVPLIPGGERIVVTEDKLVEYLKLAKEKRLAEARDAVNAIARGISRIIPLDVLRSLYTWEQFEVEVCGSSKLDVERLKKSTQWQMSTEMKDVFFEMVESFTPVQQEQLLKFTTGRSRLPADPNGKFTFVVDSAGFGDDRLPTASTCSSALHLPEYSDLATMKRQVLTAIENCSGFTVDGEGGFNELEVVAAMEREQNASSDAQSDEENFDF